MMTRAFGLTMGLVLGVLAATAAQAEVKLPALFSDHMVLQREQPIHIWGQAAPGEVVSVSLSDQPVAARADKEGKWKAMLPAHAAGGPFTMTVKAGNTITIRDVLVGEVWLASGQSNMEFVVNSAKNAEQEVAAAEAPTLRFFSVPPALSVTAQTDVQAHWVASSPQTAGWFSAAAYFFARQLQARLGVPIGILQATYGGTMIECFFDPATLAARPDLAPLASAPGGGPQGPEYCQVRLRVARHPRQRLQPHD